MPPVRSETTINQLMDRSIQRNKRRPKSRRAFVHSVEENIKRLRELIDSNPQPEPHQAATILGQVLNDVFDTAEELGLDPAGSMTLAEAG